MASQSIPEPHQWRLPTCTGQWTLCSRAWIPSCQYWSHQGWSRTPGLLTSEPSFILCLIYLSSMFPGPAFWDWCVLLIKCRSHLLIRLSGLVLHDLFRIHTQENKPYYAGVAVMIAFWTRPGSKVFRLINFGSNNFFVWKNWLFEKKKFWVEKILKLNYGRKKILSKINFCRKYFCIQKIVWFSKSLVH